MNNACASRRRSLRSRPPEGIALAKPNYRQQKRQKELSRKSRQAERLQRRTGKLEGDDAAPGDAGTGAGPAITAPDATQPKATP